ncbi:MAG: hypothetical protein IPF99_38545 [Deltaproteobacteria bacterium]|nr:hypothetical protein [Deltaproteobacteria bacterium]
MGHFAYTGVDAKGKTVRGTVDADDVKGVRQTLRRQGVFLDDATPLAQGAVDAKARAVASAAAERLAVGSR